MKKTRKHFICNYCGATGYKWSGQCYACQHWGTISEEIVQEISNTTALGQEILLENFSIIENEKTKISTNFDEIDRVLGGGIVNGSAILIGGDPGIGKSTLLLQLVNKLSIHNVSCLYITGEESTTQVKLRGARLELISNKSNIISSTNIDDILITINNITNLNMVVIDSVQTLYDSSLSSAPGTVAQIRNCSQKIINYIKQNNITLFLVGHVTKDGQLAGPKVLEHMVDTVLYFEGDQHHYFRILRATKNRFGPINEIGVFEMTGKGLQEVANPSNLFLNKCSNNISGTGVFASVEGSRPILIEIQALITKSSMTIPKHTVVGWDQNRLSMLLAVLSVRYGLNLSAYDVYLTIVGGLKITEPAADLPVLATLISAAINKPLDDNVVFFGEIGLSGEVRPVSNANARVNESYKLGFQQIICGNDLSLKSDKIIKIQHIKDLKKAIF